LGARHHLSINGVERSPSLHELANTMERHRRRLKLVEDLDGLSMCTRAVRELQKTVKDQTRTNGQKVQTTAAPPATTEQTPAMEPIEYINLEDGNETEEDILVRQVALSPPVK
jgi:hypothetical protein